jgi:hypothetical protein
MAKKSNNGDVQWYSLKYKRPIAYSTVSDSDSLAIINTPNKTANELMKELKSGRYIGVNELVKIVQAFIDVGEGGLVIKTRMV